MAMKKKWIDISSPVRSEAENSVYSASYTLRNLAEGGVIPEQQLKRFQKKTFLDDFYWRAYWRRGDLITAGGRAQLPQRVDAVVVFMHGWDGNGEIWENLPARVLGNEKNLLVLVPDVNGFYRSPFRHPDKISFQQCNPSSDMKAIELWLELIGVLGGRRYTPVVFAGHSMSGAALFYFNEKRWRQHPIGRVALAPALLMNDGLRKSFYRALGIGIYASQKLSLEQLSNSLSPKVINQLISGASKSVQATHEKVFKATAKETLANTFYAMGGAKLPVQNKKWQNFKVLLGHEDRLVGLTSMLDLLVELGIGSRQMRVVLGDHYFFSVGHHSRSLHQESREIALEEICDMVQACRR
ncbi:MAG: alpha/beta hydrolase [Anaerolineales bacterium]|uniref:Alpha/beta hydrolase n=1 Tax=Candidatus Desulfolinea nitratireducens TaxID=2841698 RepID=A0A8J6NMJ5_9CHLR|nr:alpha/beta hydrolase [Candidatus Desulfolinea nitratireducens]